jgi:hypothetical protein
VSWRLVQDTTLDQLVHHAARRGRVRLHSGRIAVLVSWPQPFDRVDGRSARLATGNGAQFRVHVRDVESIEIPEQGAP